jgi:hypothetical protein
MIVIVTFFPWYHPRTIVLVLISGASWCYLIPSDLDPRALLSMIHSYRMSSTYLRYVFLVSFLIPTWLEARTLGYLSQVLCEAGWVYNFCVTAVIAGLLVYRRERQPQLSARQHFYSSIYILYGGALWVSLLHFRIRNIPSTAGPFLLASGTLLLAQADQQQYTQALRHALRLTLRDTLASLSENVKEDEMLQLAMLRWIVDYWSTRPVSSNTTAPPTTSVEDSGSLVVRHASQTSAAMPVQRQSASTDQDVAHEEGLQWNDLLPMLDITTQQMEEEVRHTPNSNENDSIQSLRQMLASMNVDEHAQPAVDAYKQAVQDFPPDRDMALVISVARRCPASLLLIWRYLIAPAFAFPSTITLLPFLVIEMDRVLRWAEGCHRLVIVGRQETLNRSLSLELIGSIPTGIDSMTLILSRDTYSLRDVPTMLQVWFNIQASVQALEAGLTAARCAQTTVVAVNFAENIMSLAHLGYEVSQRGWIHGLSVLALELIHLQGTSQEGRYTAAIKGALKNSQTMAHNVQVLIEEDAPIIGFLQTVLGKGWLWGHDEPQLSCSTVQITELTEDDEIDMMDTLLDDSTSKKSKRSPMADPEVHESVSFNARVRDCGLFTDVESDIMEEPQIQVTGTCNKAQSTSLSSEVLNDFECREGTNDCSSAQPDVEDLFVLVSRVHELGLISDVVKMTFEAMLSGEPRQIVLQDVRQSLNKILDKEGARPMDHHSKTYPSIETIAVDQVQHDMRHLDIEGSLVMSMTIEPEGDAINFTKASPKRMVNDGIKGSDDTRSSKQEDFVRPSELVDVEAREVSSFPAISNASTWEETSQTEILSLNETLDSVSWEATVSQTIEPSGATKRGSDLTTRLQLEPVDIQESPLACAKSESDALTWVGGGLAVLGAVIGTVALHNSQPKEELNGSLDKHRVSGTIVECRTEIDDVEWVTVDSS